MSVVKTVHIPCSTCNTEISLEICFSVNAGLRPDYREAILNGSFQQFTCESCHHTFRIEPEFTYLDTRRGQYFQAHPAQKAVDWAEVERHTTELWEAAFTKGQAKSLGNSLTPRLVFGWTALVEKLRCEEYNIDDVALELVKMAIIRSSENLLMTDVVELRMVGLEDETLEMIWLDSIRESALEQLKVPYGLLEEVEHSDWDPLREQLTEGMFIDVNRLLIEG